MSLSSWVLSLGAELEPVEELQDRMCLQLDTQPQSCQVVTSLRSSTVSIGYTTNTLSEGSQDGITLLDATDDRYTTRYIHVMMCHEDWSVRINKEV